MPSGSPCNFKRVYMRAQWAKGGGGQDWGGDLRQPPVNVSKFLFFSWSLIVPLYAVICLSSSCTLAGLCPRV